MSTQPIEPVDLVLRSPIQIAASVPYLLGFIPSDSLVVVFVSDDDLHVLTARVDLPRNGRDLSELRETVTRICSRAREHGAAVVHAVIFNTKIIGLPEKLDVCNAVMAAACAAEILTGSLGFVVDGKWSNIEDPIAAPQDLAEVGVAASVQWVAHGVTFQKSRDELVERIRGEETEFAASVRAFVEAQPIGWEQSVGRTATERRRIEGRIITYFSASSHTGLQRTASPHPNLEHSDETNVRRTQLALPPVEEVATWAVALADSRVREAVLWRLADGLLDGSGRGRPRCQDVLDAMCLLLRNMPSDVAAPMASCAAAFCWQIGNGALASIAAEYGLSIRPDNVLCGLVATAVTNGAHPSVWLDMMASMSLDELRAGPARKRRPRQVKQPATGGKLRDCPG